MDAMPTPQGIALQRLAKQIGTLPALHRREVQEYIRHLTKTLACSPSCVPLAIAYVAACLDAGQPIQLDHDPKRSAKVAARPTTDKEEPCAA